jgi:acetyl-CoA synthetase
LGDGDVVWREFLGGDGDAEAVAGGPDESTNILFSSGTTGEPKAIPWTQLTPIKAAMDGRFHQDIHAGDVVAWPTNLGWMMGPWLVYASLVNGAAIALHDDAPHGGDFGRFVAEAGVTILGVVPSLVAAWRSTGCMEGLDWSRIRLFSSTGEASNPSDMAYLMGLAGGRPVIEYCGGTEIGGGYLTGTVVQPAVPGSFTTPALGIDLRILDEEGRRAASGEVFLVAPSIGLSQRLLNADHHEVYYAGTPKIEGLTLRRHGDHIEQLDGGYFRVVGRVDDAMNLGGIKVAAADIERAVAGVEGVAETAAVAIAPRDGGPGRLVVFAVPVPGHHVDVESWRSAMQERIGTRLNPLFKVHQVVAIDALPRTASAKVMRRRLRDDYANL